MQKLNKRIFGKYWINYIILFFIFLLIFYTEVFAYEVELEKRTEKEVEDDIAHFDVRVSKVWTSKGKEILSYDVSKNGSILISFPDCKVGVFNKNMDFLFELSFHSSGSYGAIWNGENILLVDVCYPAALEYHMDGRGMDSYTISDDCYSKAVRIRLRKCGEYEYYCTNSDKDSSQIVNYAYYTILRRTSESYGEEILYKSDKVVGGDMYAVCILLLFVGASIGLLCRMAVERYKGIQVMNGKPFNGIRTYSTNYSIDDCIGLLSRKNIYDILQYSFRLEKENKAELVVTGYNKSTRIRTRVCYEMEFNRNRKTEINIKSITEERVMSVRYIPQWWMDEFMAQKLDALPVDAETDKAAGQK